VVFVLKGDFATTAMGIMPHTDIDQALELALDLDIPFWPQLPRVSYYEDMYVQITEHFPGISVDEKNQRVNFSTAAFYEGLENYLLLSEEDSHFTLTEKYSVVYRRFLQRDLSSYQTIRGQSIGPVSMGLKITDEERKPIIYHPEVRELLFDFVARKVNVQYRELTTKNPNAFVWLDEPGLEIIFGSFSGYTSERAREDYARFLTMLEGPKGVHLCGNPDWAFLLREIELDILSLDALGCGRIFSRYTGEIKAFLERGGIIAWGIIPTLTAEQEQYALPYLFGKLEEYWDYLAQHGVDRELLVKQAWLAPARCCLINADGDATVTRAFRLLKELAKKLKEKYSA